MKIKHYIQKSPRLMYFSTLSVSQFCMFKSNAFTPDCLSTYPLTLAFALYLRPSSTVGFLGGVITPSLTEIEVGAIF